MDDSAAHSTASTPTATPTAATSSSLASYSVHRVLSGHHGCLWHCAWSRDDSLVLACGAGSEVSVWDSATGQLRLLCESGHREALHSAYFVDGDRAFVTSSPDKQIIMRDLQGAMLHRWSADVSTDMHVTHNQRFILAATQHSRMEAFDVKSKRRTQSAAHTAARSAAAHSSLPPGAEPNMFRRSACYQFVCPTHSQSALVALHVCMRTQRVVGVGDCPVRQPVLCSALNCCGGCCGFVDVVARTAVSVRLPVLLLAVARRHASARHNHAAGGQHNARALYSCCHVPP